VGFEEEDAMVEALPDADWGPAASVAVVTMLAVSASGVGVE